MIKANELRVGNKIFYGQINLNTGAQHEAEITVDANVIKEIELNDGRHYWPIPVTHEWLERLGFLNIAGSFRKDGLYKMEFVFYVKEGILRYQTKGSGFSIELEHIQYVHQLQNLYFALTGEDLTTPEGDKL